MSSGWMMQKSYCKGFMILANGHFLHDFSQLFLSQRSVHYDRKLEEEELIQKALDTVGLEFADSKAGKAQAFEKRVEEGQRQFKFVQ